MAEHAALASLLAEFGRTSGIGSLALDGSGVCALAFDGDLVRSQRDPLDERRCTRGGGR